MGASLANEPPIPNAAAIIPAPLVTEKRYLSNGIGWSPRLRRLLLWVIIIAVFLSATAVVAWQMRLPRPVSYTASRGQHQLPGSCAPTRHSWVACSHAPDSQREPRTHPSRAYHENSRIRQRHGTEKLFNSNSTRLQSLNIFSSDVMPCS